MFDVHAYLRAEIRRYFPDALGINVADVDETWHIAVTLPSNTIINLTMEVGSDDDCFRFTNNATGTEYTVPFSPEIDS